MLGRVKPTLAQRLAAFAGLTRPARARERHLPERPGRRARAPVNFGLVDVGSGGQAAHMTRDLLHVSVVALCLAEFSVQFLRCAHRQRGR